MAQNRDGVPPDDAWLSERERATLAAFRIDRRRADWRLGRWTAKFAIAACRGLTPQSQALAAIEVRPAPTGAPEAFFRDQPAGVALSLSHSQGIGFCAVGPAAAAVGCDVERVEPRSPGFLQDFFTDEEQERVRSVPIPDRDALATLLWSAKESALKVLQCGLRADTRSVIASPASMPAEAAPLWCGLTVRCLGGRTFHGWWREQGGYVFTLVADPAPGEPIAVPMT